MYNEEDTSESKFYLISIFILEKTVSEIFTFNCYCSLLKYIAVATEDILFICLK